MVFELLSILSRTINVILGGKSNRTFSAASYKDNLYSVRFIDAFFRIITRENNHCKNCWEAEINRAILLLKDEGFTITNNKGKQP